MTTTQSLTENLLAVCGLPCKVHYVSLANTVGKTYLNLVDGTSVEINGLCRIVGFANQLTEEECHSIMPYVNTAQLGDGIFYSADNVVYNHSTSTEALKSLIESHGLYLENPLSFDTTGITYEEWRHNQQLTNPLILHKI